MVLPNNLFYNAGISTYIWILTNNKPVIRKGKVKLINDVDFSKRMSSKRNEITQEQIEEIVRLYGNFREGEYVKIFVNEDLGCHKITVERPLSLNLFITLLMLKKIRTIILAKQRVCISILHHTSI